jgi:uncharacterized protein (TIGR00299 family) protein
MIYLDCSSGAAGDMLAGALIDSGADWRKIMGVLKPLAKVRVEKVKKRGVSAIKFEVGYEPGSREYVELAGDVKKLKLSPKARKLALRVLKILAEAEAKAHDIPLGRVHLHEAADCVVDSVAVALALEDLGWLSESFVSSVVSAGYIAPATKHIITEYGVPVRFTSDRELLTPTGAALLAALAVDYRRMGYCSFGAGAGSMSLPWPNVLRVGLVKPKAVLESNIDDCTPEHISHMMAALMDAGALDVHVMPCVMKKGRLGFLVRVLTDEPERHASMIMDETGSLGVRVMGVESRFELGRRTSKVSVRFGGKTEHVRVKYTPLGFKPEFDDLAAIAARHKTTFRSVRERVLRKIQD